MKSFAAAIVLLGSLLSATTACLHRAESAVYGNMLIDPQSLKGDIRFTHCDFSLPLFRCRQVSYECKQPGCERLQVKHARKSGPKSKHKSAATRL